MIRRSRAVTLCAAVVTLAACGGTSASAPPVSLAGKVVHLGAVLSLTGAGSALGQEQQKAIVLAVEELNHNGGINGATISADVADDGSDQQQGVQATQAEIQSKKVLGVIGPSLSNTALLADGVAQKLKTPMILPSATGGGLVGQCGQPCDFIFRDSLGETAAIHANVKAAAARFRPRNALLFYAVDDKSSADGAATFQQAFADNGIAVGAGSVQSFPKAETDFHTYVTAAVAQKADLWAVSAGGGNAAALLTEARAQGFSGPILGGNGFNSDAVSVQAGKAGKGAQSAGAYYRGLDSAVNKRFVATYSARYKDSAGAPLQPGQIAAQAYAAVLLFADAARRAGLTFGAPGPDRARLKEALGQGTTETPMGPFAFTSGNDARQPIYVVSMDGRGGFDLVTTVPPA